MFLPVGVGFTPKMPAQFLMPPPPPRDATQAEKKAWKSGEQWLTDLDKMWTQANAQLDKSHEQHAKYYNKKRRNERETFAVGKYVYLRSLTKIIEDMKNEMGEEGEPAIKEHIDSRIEAMEKDNKTKAKVL